MALSDEILRLHRHVVQPEETKSAIKRRLFQILYGTYSSVMIGEIALVSSFAIAMTTSITIDEFFRLTTMTILLTCGGYYQIFWLKYRQNVVEELENFSEFAKQLEKKLTEDENEVIKNSIRTLRRIQNYLNVLFVCEVTATCLQPIEDFRLPMLMRGLPFYHPYMIVARCLLCLVTCGLGASAMEYFVVNAAMVLFSKAGLKVLVKRLGLVNTKCVEDVQGIAKLHSDLLSVMGRLVYILKGPNGLFAFQSVLMALLATAGGVVGVRSPETLILIPGCFTCISMLCVLSDIMETSSLEVAKAVYNSSRWLDADIVGRRLLLFVMTRSLKPVVIAATLSDDFSRPLILKILNNWYRFLQAVLKLVKVH